MTIPYNDLQDTYTDVPRDICPVNDSGNHRYFIYKVLIEFEPTTAHVMGTLDAPQTPRLYEKVEYAVSGCNCGSAIKQKVKQPWES